MTIIPFLVLLLSISPSYHYAFTASFSNSIWAPLSPRDTSSLKASKTAIQQTPVVICPGFGNDSIDYLSPLKQPRSTSFIAALERRGFNSSLIYTVPINRIDWIRVALGLFDIPRFYTGNALPTGFGYGWYIERLKETVNRAYEENGCTKVLLVGHSAGGWLARAAMGDGVWTNDDNEEGTKDIRTADRIRCLVTVGAIHKVPSDPTTCITRGALKNTDEMYPGALLREEGVGYVAVGGRAVKGDNSVDTSNEEEKSDTENYTPSLTAADDLYSIRGEGSASRVAYTSYEAVCGDGNTIGDGVVPLEWTKLDGAKEIQLDGVIHSINEAGTTLPTDKWYGSENVIDKWLPTVLDEARIDANDYYSS